MYTNISLVIPWRMVMFSLHWNAKLLNILVHWDVKDVYDLPSQHVYHKKLSTQQLQIGCPILSFLISDGQSVQNYLFKITEIF